MPAYFNDAQRQATKDAGAIAGLVIGLLVLLVLLALLFIRSRNGLQSVPGTAANSEAWNKTRDLSSHNNPVYAATDANAANVNYEEVKIDTNV